MISIKEVEHVALLGRLKLTEEEKKLYSKQLSDILEHARKLEHLDTADAPPTSHVLPLQNVFREDRAGAHMATDKVLANAPKHQDDYFKVPRIL